jgi:hypothetical protein
MTLTDWDRWLGFQSTFPSAYARAAQNWSSGSLALAISNLAWPSVVGCGLPNLGLSHYATLPSLLPGLDKVGALHHFSLMLTLFRASSRTAFYGARHQRTIQGEAMAHFSAPVAC